MVLSTVDIKKRIVKSVFDFSNNVEAYRAQHNPSNIQMIELLNLNKEINKIIDALSGDLDGLSEPNVDKSEYEKLRRVLELSFRMGSDLNSVSMDIGERINYSNQLLQRGIDYIFDNLKNKNLTYDSLSDKFQVNSTEEKLRHDQLNRLRNPKKVSKQELQKAVHKKKPSPMAGLLFLLIVAVGGYYIYDSMFNNHATRVSTLIQEYRSDQTLSDQARYTGSKNIKVFGSPSVVNAVDKWKDNFLLENNDLKLDVKSGDSGTAISKLLGGEITIAASSRMPNITERKKSQKLNSLLADHKVALDAVAVFVNPKNPVTAMSVDDLKEVFTSDSPNWKRFGWNSNTEFKRFSPSPESGTYAFMKERVLFTEEYSDNIIKLYDPAQMVSMVESNPGAIGFASLSNVLGRKVKILKVSTYLKSQGVSPVKNNLIDVNTIKRGEYPLTRYLYLITSGDIDESSAKFIDFFRSEEGQKVLGSKGLVSIY